MSTWPSTSRRKSTSSPAEGCAADTVELFSSETLDGQVCAQAVARYLTANGFDAKVEANPGLQVQDARKFARFGVVAFLRKQLLYIDGHGNGQCIFNPTGGFKALVP